MVDTIEKKAAEVVYLTERIEMLKEDIKRAEQELMTTYISDNWTEEEIKQAKTLPHDKD